MNNNILKIGIIGLGVGERHLVSYRNIAGCEVSAICDINKPHLDDVGNRYGVEQRYTDYRKITEDPDIDVISICSYDDTHAEQAISAFRHGKHVMVEKPVALYRHEAEAVMRAQQDSQRFISSNLILRKSPRFIELRQQIQAGEFGDIFHIEGDYVHDILWKITEGWRGKMEYYSVIYGGGIHLIDLMRWLTGYEIVEVCGMGGRKRVQDSSYRFDDTITNLFRFNSGATGKCLTTYGPRRTKFHALNVYGTEKTFINDLPNAKLFTGDNPETDEFPVTTPYPGMEKGDLLPDFIAAIRENREPDVSAQDVFRVMEICLTAQESLETRRTLSIAHPF